ncbi:hypothetical protein FPQ18DRAFT_367682 [Pyronema domesticum]|uniref:Similar to Metal homeostatis protein BSD2 acc. no. P38356 n=1 Tax=Pyronema omphalodes (strain CBS 100304) TaxID=1076935 RepID=U4LN01_PYROM|nr:hypothetical protein FPQ18DRAFT_367682 [Pyronema domesticum]CCX15599.1 Similar to Metal homeostatis protein BSD2; acc. no. P38356 [Pyronema omphalodes CBS 100304]
MSHRYERIDHDEDEDLDVHGNIVSGSSNNVSSAPQPIPSSPPPSFRSRPTSPTPGENELDDAFDNHSDDEDGDMRNHRRGTSNANFESEPLVSSSAQQPSSYARAPQAYNTVAPSGPIMGAGQTDGVFGNLSAKPSVGEKLEEHPPTYEQAAADATPPYWETTILAPGMASDEVFIDGLPVGSFFAFFWNALISMSFQLVGFLLTYLLHTTHAAKNGSRAGLGITLVQFGFMMRGHADGEDGAVVGSPPSESTPQDPNSYNFQNAGDATAAAGSEENIGRSEWLSYALMVVGWFILIRALSDYFRARKTEQLVLASPDRGLGVAVVAEGETPERAV